jgi:hypothetical protein
LSRIRLPLTLAITALLLPGQAHAQGMFDWPIRSAIQPEAVLTSAGVVFWNPGGMAGSVGSHQEIWLTHIVGPASTGVRGVAGAGVMTLPFGFRGGLGYWHLGVGDIPRTIDSPNIEFGDINVAEDVALLALARDLGGRSGGGASIRLRQSSMGGDTRTYLEGELGIHYRSGLPLSPRMGLAIQGLGGNPAALAGLEVSLPALASSRVPVRAGYGFQTGRSFDPPEHRISLRASWMEQIHAGVGLSYLGTQDGWTPLGSLGADLGRYSLSVLREGMANGFGAIHFYRAAIRFP